MRNLTRALLWLFVFSLPWEQVAFIPWLGTISRLIGVAAALCGIATVVVETRVRKPGVVLWLAGAFVFANVLSLWWTISYESSITRVLTYAQLFALIWLIWEFVADVEAQRRLMFAYCLGGFVPIAGLLWNYSHGITIFSWTDVRYSVSGTNAGDLGLTLALGIPMAWHLLFNGRKGARTVGALYCGLALVGIMLTGTRSAFLAAVVGLSVVPSTLLRVSVRTAAVAGAALAIAFLMLITVTPVASWNRILTIRDEMSGQATFSGRSEIWKAGLKVFEQHPALGVGAGAFMDAVSPLLARKRAAHNVLMAILVEQGIFGLAIFGSLCLACAWLTLSLPPPDRTLWIALMLAWFVGSMALSWQYAKPTWLLFGLLAARSAVKSRDPFAARLRTRIPARSLATGLF